MQLTELFAEIPHHYAKLEDVDIQKIEYDSRSVKAGDLFVCIVGAMADGHRFAPDAAAKGAVALLVERELDIDIPQIIVPDTRKAMAQAAACFYGYPSRKMKMVGITGTNGKTTGTYMLKGIAEAAGKKVGLFGTITNLIGETVVPSRHTTPESVDLQAVLARMAEEKVDVCFMEVSSHALIQSRAYGIAFDVGIFTNLTQDHLDYHKTLENYRDAKRLLFDQCKAAVVNVDDAQGGSMVQGKDYPVLRVGIRENADVSAKDIDITTDGVRFDLVLPDAQYVHVSLKIPGLFSVYNAMTSAAAAYMLGYETQHIKEGLEALDHVSGRLEKLNTGKQSFNVLLDYAHTPDALENVLKTIRGFAKARVITLFGCGGGRDVAKRPMMGEVAGRYSDLCIITSDNPRDEEPVQIISMIEEGMKKSGCDYVTIENREKAIRFALEQAQKDDIVLLAGKGHETYQETKGVRRPFNEKEIVGQLIAAMDGRKGEK